MPSTNIGQVPSRSVFLHCSSVSCDKCTVSVCRGNMAAELPDKQFNVMINLFPPHINFPGTAFCTSTKDEAVQQQLIRFGRCILLFLKCP